MLHSRDHVSNNRRLIYASFEVCPELVLTTTAMLCYYAAAIPVLYSSDTAAYSSA